MGKRQIKLFVTKLYREWEILIWERLWRLYIGRCSILSTFLQQWWKNETGQRQRKMLCSLLNMTCMHRRQLIVKGKEKKKENEFQQERMTWERDEIVGFDLTEISWALNCEIHGFKWCGLPTHGTFWLGHISDSSDSSKVNSSKSESVIDAKFSPQIFSKWVY